MVITQDYYLIVASIIFTLGMVGFLANAGNIIMMLVSVEVMLIASHINFITRSCFTSDITGQIFVIFALTTAAAEAAIALAILVMYYRGRGTIDVDSATVLKG